MSPVDRPRTELVPMGDRAWLATFASAHDARAWSEAARGLSLEDVEIVLAFNSVGIIADGDSQNLAEIEERLGRVETPRLAGVSPGQLHQVPVLYDGADLEEVARILGLSPVEVIEIHSGTDYTVHAIGFQPGFPYLGPLPSPLNQIPRRESPRTRVPSGSVAIAAGQTGIYPAELPGGWHLLGRTPVSIVDVSRGRFPIEAGDLVRFVPINARQFSDYEGAAL